MSRYGTIGKTCKLPTERTYCISYSVVLIQSISALVDVEYLRFVCSSGMILELARARVQGASIPDLGVAHIRSLPIAVPPLTEQIRIREEVSRKLSVSDRLRTTLVEKLGYSDGLRRALLKSAFAGNLVPHIANDEPASVLLERIRSGRAVSERTTVSLRRRKEFVHA